MTALDNSLADAADALTGGEPGPWPAHVWTQLHALVAQAPGQLAHAGMHYRCEKCGFEWLVYLAIGLEGPEPLKSLGLALPVPFGVNCPAWGLPEEGFTPCGGSMLHVDWSRDVAFEPLALVPDNAPRFVLPESAVGEPPCGRLSMPTPALVRGRQGKPAAERRPGPLDNNPSA